MVNVPVVAKRELTAYFLSPVGYMVLTAFALAHGVLFSIYVGQVPLDPDMTMMEAMRTTVTLLIFAAPILTMRLLSEEVSSGTIETLLTTPVSNAEVVLGKYLGALMFGTIMLVPLVLEVVFMGYVAEIDYGPVMSGFLGLFLLIAQFLAIGVLFSAVTRVQFAAAIMTLFSLVVLFVLWFLVRDSTATTAQVLKYIAPPTHFSSFVGGVIDSRDLVYFVATTVFFLFVAVRVLEYKNWR